MQERYRRQSLEDSDSEDDRRSEKLSEARESGRGSTSEEVSKDIDSGLENSRRGDSNTYGFKRCTVDTNLLLTCRLIYLEAKFIPIRSNIHNIYGYRRQINGGEGDYGMPFQRFIISRLYHLTKCVERPHYGQGQVCIRSGPSVFATSTVYHRGMSAKIQAEIQQV
jgi:hypothetical protein